jgi:hypothetical protein
MVLLFACAGLGTAGATSAFELELEGGAVWQSKNDVQSPNDDTATRFSLVDLAGNGPAAAGRLYLTWNVNERHGLRVLAAPFQLSETGVPADDVTFAGETFESGTPVDAAYTFNSWRLSYRYRFAKGDGYRWWVGFTAKLRDAEIRLDQGSRSANDTDLGFVPLLHVSGEVGIAPRLAFLVDADALAGGPGRAIDASAKIGFDVNPRTRFTLGYRTLEGGADVDAVYTFAWLHYAVASAVIRF